MRTKAEQRSNMFSVKNGLTADGLACDKLWLFFFSLLLYIITAKPYLNYTGFNINSAVALLVWHSGVSLYGQHKTVGKTEYFYHVKLYTKLLKKLDNFIMWNYLHKPLQKQEDWKHLGFRPDK